MRARSYCKHFFLAEMLFYMQQLINVQVNIRTSFFTHVLPNKHSVKIVLNRFLLLGLMSWSTPVSGQLTDTLPTLKLVDVPNEIVKVNEFLNQDAYPIIQEPTVSTVEPEIDTIQAEIGALSEISEQLLRTDLPWAFYQSLIFRWERIIEGLEEIDNSLSAYEEDLVLMEEGLINRSVRWEEGMSGIPRVRKTREIRERITGVITSLTTARKAAEDSLALSLKAQNQISDLQLQVNQQLRDLKLQREKQLASLIQQKELPFAQVLQDQDSFETIFDNQLLIDFAREDSQNYFERKGGYFIGLGIAYLFIFGILMWVKRSYREEENPPPELIRGRYVFNRPFVSALMFTLLLMLFITPDAPVLINKLLNLLFIFPFLLIFHGLVVKPLRWSLYYVIGLYYLHQFTQVYFLDGRAMRIMIFFVGLAVAAFLVWFLIRRKSLVSDSRQEGFYFRFLQAISPVMLLYVFCGTVANLMGYGKLANMIVFGTLVALILALIFMAVAVSLRAVVYMMLQTEMAHRSKILSRHRQQIIQWLWPFINFSVVLAWFYFTLKVNLLWEPLYSWGLEVWESGYTFGELTVSVGSLVEFFLILVFAWMISHLIRLVLREEVLDRINLPRGVPMAISSLTQYALVAVGFLLALATLGFNLQNLGILAGALGVGIGFGLQTVVNNFISGLILVFERPVTEGDIVNVAGVDGQVVSIGIRSSRIRQWDGAELIVPNSLLITDKVTNWTRGLYKRRVILTVYTDLDCIPEEIQELMTASCKGVEGIRSDPEPITYFNGIEGNAYSFSLFYWLSSDILVQKSNVQTAVDKALREAGIKRKIPQPMTLLAAEKAHTTSKIAIQEKPEHPSNPKSSPTQETEVVD